MYDKNPPENGGFVSNLKGGYEPPFPKTEGVNCTVRENLVK